MTTYRLGLIHDHAPPEVPDLAVFAAKPIPKPPVSVPTPLCVWPMADAQVADLDSCHFTRQFRRNRRRRCYR